MNSNFITIYRGNISSIFNDCDNYLKFVEITTVIFGIVVINLKIAKKSQLLAQFFQLLRRNWEIQLFLAPKTCSERTWPQSLFYLYLIL